MSISEVSASTVSETRANTGMAPLIRCKGSPGVQSEGTHSNGSTAKCEGYLMEREAEAGTAVAALAQRERYLVSTNMRAHTAVAAVAICEAYL